MTPPVGMALLRAILVPSCFRGALPPVDFRAVCFVRAMATRIWFPFQLAGGGGVVLVCVDK